MMSGAVCRAGGRCAAVVGVCPFEDIPATAMTTPSVAVQSLIHALRLGRLCATLLEGRAKTKGKEPHLIGRNRRHLAELGTGWIQVRTQPLLAIEYVLRVDAQLQGPAAATNAEAALDR
jgi:hypothetical protein